MRFSLYFLLIFKGTHSTTNLKGYSNKSPDKSNKFQTMETIRKIGYKLICTGILQFVIPKLEIPNLALELQAYAIHTKQNLYSKKPLPPHCLNFIGNFTAI